MEGGDIYQAPQCSSATIEDMSDAELRRYHSKDELCILAVGWFYLYLGSVLCSLTGLSMWLYWLSPCLLFMVSTFVSVLGGILFIIIGFGLRNFDAWARPPAYVASVVAMCLFPMGTLAGGACLVLLIRHASEEMFTEKYRVAVMTQEYGARKYGWLGASLGILTGLSIWLVFFLLHYFYGYSLR
ncbi:hypothetical protein SAMN02745181_0239 [Rubritalea squalenifaciens DSM 18772]|uniref:Uncharacterized protein n=3 Tax=Rubritalea TaxID=361050 RepID=A0A1M6BJJ6_9BACT|nr:hypothetical protein [Rubritalea squalenifaciens]SHI48901.1 hypothetical protein SAMN02745181_0239 [Rubritalea squalenifaciens DSM 18772]